MESEKACQNVKPDETSEENVINNNNNDVPKVVGEDSAPKAVDDLQEAIEINNSDRLPADDEKEGQESKASVVDVPPPVVVRKKQRQKRRIQHGGAKRESTPIRYLGDISGDEMTVADSEIVKDEKSPHVNGKEWSSSSTSENISRQGSFRKDQAKKGSISEIAQQELVTLYNKTKKSLTAAAQRGRERFRKYEQQLSKRSQSAPQKFVEELQESLEKVQKIEYPLRRKYSDSNFPVSVNGSFRSVSPPQILRNRRCTKRATTPKIIEVLDPKTSNVVQRKSIGRVGGVGKTPRYIVSLKVASIKDIPRNFQIHKQQFHRDYTKLKQTFRKCCLELFLIMIFCGLGGIMFKFTEGTFETYYKCGVKRVKRDFIDLLWSKSHNLREDDWKSLARSRLRGFEEELHNAHEAGMTDYSGMRSWSFLNGIIYCLTIVTTIGYGHMFPKTNTGRALTIVYALIGIPLFLIALTDFGKLFTRGIKFVWSFIRRLYYTGSCRKVRKNSGVDDIFKGAQNLYDYATFKRPSLFDPNTPNLGDAESQHQTTDTPTTPAISNFEIDDEFNLPISVALFILVSYIFCGAVMYMVIEKWNFFEAFYFVFISMSTIGFGDYVPRDQVFMIVSIVYLVFGLALMSMCINVVQAKLSDTFKKASSKIGATMGLQVDEEDSVITATPQNIEEVTPVQVETTDERSSDA
ncbi:unnamed protein product [Ceutorhynchus assimilis]|uniref:Potassium channel domain-containing protein n=1 Tax=Ceutorhynchus assimilis TaxID=467358 RepID=A0A9N9M9I9_9CUCU|nr:unnamed protein product [Ceutorhynchus assimilis]